MISPIYLTTFDRALLRYPNYIRQFTAKAGA
jgi:hypothetical protein